MTLEERERYAWLAGNYELAALLAELIDTQEELNES